MTGADAQPRADDDAPADDARAIGWLKRCSRCPAVVELVAVTRSEWLCAECWHMAGHPWPGPGSITEIHEAEIATRRHMTDRGGK